MKAKSCAVGRTIRGGAALCLLAIGVAAHADATYKVHYVWTNSPHPGEPYNDWTNAAHEIQTAVDYASADDTVRVTNGVYESSGDGTNLVFINKALTLESVNGAEATILDGGGTNRCIFARLANIIVAGFTLTNGVSCSTYNRGGGIFMRTTGLIRRCIIVGNEAGSGGGGGVSMGYSIDGSRAGVIEHCEIVGNTASGTGGGIMMFSSTICTMRFCRVENNTATSYGGGAYIIRGQLINSEIVGNTSENADGGGLYSERSMLRNCLVASNQCLGGSYGGGGVYFNDSNHLDSCTIVMNRSAVKNGGGVSFTTATSSVANTTFALNVAPAGAGIAYPLYWHNPLVHYTNCSFQSRSEVNNSYSATNAACLFELDNGFANTNVLDFRLVRGSPCVDAGANQSEWMADAVDLDGNPRITGGIVDIGAYERFYPKGSVLIVY